MKRNNQLHYIFIIVIALLFNTAYALPKMQPPIKALALFQYELSKLDNQQFFCPAKNMTPTQRNALLKQAYNWYYQKALQGNIDAQYYVGAAHYNLLGTNNPDGAFKWFHKAALQGNVKAMRQLGGMYLTSNTIENQPNSNMLVTNREGAYWLQKAAALDDAQSQFMLASYYLAGWVNNKKEDARALQLIEQAVKENSAYGYFSLANFYFLGLGDYVKKDYAKALQLYEKALTLKDISFNHKITVLKMLTFMYGHGLGTKKDPRRALYWQKRLQELIKKSRC